MLALAETRFRSDLAPRDEGPGEGAPPTASERATLPSAETLPGAPAETGADSDARTPQASPDKSVPLVFEVRDNQRLSQALSHFLETQGWRLEWESQSDFVVRRGYRVRGQTLKDVLLEALGEYRLSAVLYSGNLVVAVTGGER
jgi:hypothetical protein